MTSLRFRNIGDAARFAAAVAVVLTLGSCGDSKITEAKAAVELLLTDPSSAEYHGVIEDDANRRVCGYVNAKNKFGGYVGKTLFIYEMDFNAANFRKLWTDGAVLDDCMDREFGLVIAHLKERWNIGTSQIKNMVLVDDLVCGRLDLDGKEGRILFRAEEGQFELFGKGTSAVADYNALLECKSALDRYASRGGYFSTWPK